MKAFDLMTKYLRQEGLSQREFARRAQLSNPMPLTRMKKGAVMEKSNLEKIIKALPQKMRSTMRRAYESDVNERKSTRKDSRRRYNAVYSCSRVEKLYTSSVDFADVEVWTTRKDKTGLHFKSHTEEVMKNYMELIKFHSGVDAEEMRQEVEQVARSRGKMIGHEFATGGLVITLQARHAVFPSLRWQFHALDLFEGESGAELQVQQGKEWTTASLNDFLKMFRGHRLSHLDVIVYCLHKLQEKSNELAIWSSDDENRVGVDAATLKDFLTSVQNLTTLVQERDCDPDDHHKLLLSVDMRMRALKRQSLDAQIKMKLLEFAVSYFNSFHKKS